LKVCKVWCKIFFEIFVTLFVTYRAVEPANSAENLLNAFEAAKEESEVVEERLKNKSIRNSESEAKTTVRGTAALKKVLKILKKYFKKC